MRSTRRRLRPFSLFALIALSCGSLFTGALPASAVGECGPLDVGFVIDVTGSMGPAIANVQSESTSLLDQIDAASAGDTQLALLSFSDTVTVNDDLAGENRSSVESDIQGLAASGGGGTPEASDEALNTAVNGLDEADRDEGLQTGDFNGTWRGAATKILILITDAPPGGFDDTYTEGTDDVNAHNVALGAAAGNMLISAVYVPTEGIDPTTSGIMQDYASTTGGVYLETAADGTGTSAAISDIIAGCGEDPGTTTGTIPPSGGTVASPPIGPDVIQRVVVKAPAGTAGGEVSIQIPDPNAEPCPGTCFGDPMHVTGFDTGSTKRLALKFVFKRGVIPMSTPLSTISLTRNEVEVPPCVPGRPDPCVRTIKRNARGTVWIIILSSDETDPRYRGRG